MILSIRKATTDDCLLINELASQIWGPTYSDILSPDQLSYMFEMMYSPLNLAKQMEEKLHQFFIVSRNDEPIGYLSIETVSPTHFIIQKIYTLPSVQGKGVGRFTIEAGIEYLKGLCPEPFKLGLFVNRDNKAVGFYKRMGFQVVDTRDFHIGNDYYMNDYIMEMEVK